jgi:hypothetical protein
MRDGGSIPDGGFRGKTVAKNLTIGGFWGEKMEANHPGRALARLKQSASM